MADLPSELRTLVDRYGAHVLDDADGLRATLNDFLDEDSSPGDVNLLVDAVRFGALERLRSLLGQGAEPAAATTDVAEGLAQRRGGDAESAYWACAVLGFAADLSSADLIPGTQERPSSLLPPSAFRDTPQTGGADETYVVGQSRGAPHGDPNATRSSGERATPGPAHGHVTDVADAPVAEHGSPGAIRNRGMLVAAAAVLALIIAGVVTFALTRSHSDGPTAMHGAGHSVPIETVTEKDTFGHFGTPATMKKVLNSPCSNAGVEKSHYQEYRCTFKEHPTYDIDFSNADPAKKGSKGHLPPFITHPGPRTIVTIQPPTSGSSLHAYVMTYQGKGTDHIRDTHDDVVALTLYDVDTDHPGSAKFESTKPYTEPLTRDLANRLLGSIGVDEDNFPPPKPFKGPTNAASDPSSLKNFARQFRTSEEIEKFCVEGFLVISGEAEHVKCFASKDPKASAYAVSFGLQRKSSGLRVAIRSYGRGRQSWSWSDKVGRRGRIIPSPTAFGAARLFWYEENLGDGTWGLLTSNGKSKSLGDLQKIFEGFANHPTVSRPAR